MSKERKWVLKTNEGSYYVGGGRFSHKLCEASHSEDVHAAYHFAQRLCVRKTECYLTAIPIERETERVVEEIEGPAEAWIVGHSNGYICRGGYSMDIADATVFDAQRLLVSESVDHSHDVIPVRATEKPGGWREVGE